MISIKYNTFLAGGAVAHLGYRRALLLMRAMIVPIVARTIKICASLRMASSSTCSSPSPQGLTALLRYVELHSTPSNSYYTTKSTTIYKNPSEVRYTNPKYPRNRVE